jgi:hypothetical protein
MSPKTFLIAHGEKLAVVAVAGGCALILSGSINDPTIRPKDNLQQIEAINTKIDTVFKKQSPPVLKEPRPYLDQMLGRIAEGPVVTPTMAWLTTPPDKGRHGGGGKGMDGTYLYVYELLPPAVSVEDAIGSLNITVAAPTVVSVGQGRRVSGEPLRRWERVDHRGTVSNTGRMLGLQLEIKVGDNDWRPLALPGASADGVLPLEAIGTTPVTIPTPEPWQRHQIRARVIAAATALDLDGPPVERPRQSVVVYAGQASAGPTEDQPLLDALLAQYGAKQGPLFKGLLRPVPGPLPANAKLSEGEKLFLGPWSPIAKVDATASVRFALIGLSTAPREEDPTKFRDVGRFLLLRLFQQGDDRMWMKTPLEMKFGEGDVLGAKDVDIDNPFQPGNTIRVNLPTPFVVDKLIKDQKRILYWMVKVKSRKGGGRDKDLDLDKKEVTTDVVVLKNPETGSTIDLTKLINIIPPLRNDILIYPHRAAAYIERDDFIASPSGFRQWGLSPEQPKAFQPETGPLTDLYKLKVEEHALDRESFRTDTVYYAFPDGRLAWWDVVEHALKVQDPEGVMSTTTAAPVVAPPVVPTPVGKAPADGMPPEIHPPGDQPMPPPAPPKRR